MPEKKNKTTCLADLMMKEMAEIDEMIEDGYLDYLEEENDIETDRE